MNFVNYLHRVMGLSASDAAVQVREPTAASLPRPVPPSSE